MWKETWELNGKWECSYGREGMVTQNPFPHTSSNDYTHKVYSTTYDT